MIYTMGVGKETTETLIARFQDLSINKVWDIRSGIVASFFDTAAGNTFEAKVKAAGMEYRYMDLRFGKDVCLEFGIGFFANLEELKQCAADCTLLILGDHIDPARCVRGLVIGRAVQNNIFHVLKDGELQTQEQLEATLVTKRFPQKDQCSMFSVLSFGDMACVAYQNAIAKL